MHSNIYWSKTLSGRVSITATSDTPDRGMHKAFPALCDTRQALVSSAYIISNRDEKYSDRPCG